jgi:hypothetical protein
LDKFEFSKTNASEEYAERQFISSAKTVRDSLKSGSPTETKIFLPAKQIPDFMRMTIPYSTASLYQREGNITIYILDSVPSNLDIKPDIQSHDVRNLARKLTKIDPLQSGLLKCLVTVKV